MRVVPAPSLTVPLHSLTEWRPNPLQ